MKIKIIEKEEKIEIYDFVYKGKPQRTQIFLDTIKLDRKEFKEYFSETGSDIYTNTWFHIKPEVEKEFPELFL